MPATPLPPAALRNAFTALATLPLASEETIPAILALMTETLGVGAVFMARFDGDALRLDHTLDPAHMGLHDGIAVDINETYCQTMYLEASSSLVVEDSAADPHYAALATTRDLGIKAYSGVSLYRPDGSPYGTLCTLHPTTRRVSAEEMALLTLAGRMVMQVIETQDNEKRLRTLVALTPIGAAILNDRGDFEAVNDLFAEMLGYTAAELMGQHFHVLHPPQQWVTLQEAYDRQVSTAARGSRDETLLTRTGTTRRVRVASMQFPGTGGRAQRLWYVTDLTAQREQEARLHLVAGQDMLTKRENRAPFVRRLNAMLLDEPNTVVLYSDLDAFKAVNDTLGYEAGDTVLSVVAERLRAGLRPGDAVARLGGDEFAVLLAGVTDGAEIEAIAKNLLTQVAAPIVVDGQWVRVTMSMGVAQAPLHGEDGGQLMRAADAAMQRIKRSGKHGVAFAADDPGEMNSRGA